MSASPAPATQRDEAQEADVQAIAKLPGFSFSILEFKSKSLLVNTLVFIMSLPLQALAFLVLPRVIHAAVCCINEVYEATGRRARPQFSAFLWVKIAGGVVLLGFYHVWLVRLVIGAWKGIK